MPPRSKRLTPTDAAFTAQYGITPEQARANEKAAKDRQQLEFVYEMREYLLKVLRAAGCGTKGVEGLGDCALISVMYDKEVSAGDANSLPKEVRKTQVTDRRKGVLKFMSTSRADNPAMFLTFEEVINVAFCLGVNGVEKVKGDADAAQRRGVATKIAAKLAQWKTALYYGDLQQAFMAGFGWMLRRNILQIIPKLDINRSEGVSRSMPYCVALRIAMLIRLRCDCLMVLLTSSLLCNIQLATKSSA